MNRMSNLTPAKAIREHCRVMCMNSKVDYSCECILMEKRIKLLERIQHYCRVCKFPNTVKSCDGVILNTEESREYGKCPLHGFRYGKERKRG